MGGKDFFKKVTAHEDRDRVIQEFVHSDEDLFSKTPNDQVVILKPFRLNKNSFSCHIDDKSPVPFDLPYVAVHNFSLQGERYFFKGMLKQDNHTFEVFFDGDLYQLQRRQSYRVRIPVGLNGVVSIVSLNGRPVNQRGKLVDLSIGGCAFELPENEAFRPDDRLMIEVHIKNEKVFEAQGIVRHLFRPRLNATTSVQYGFEFHPPNQTALEQRVFTLTLDIHRELYGRLA